MSLGCFWQHRPGHAACTTMVADIRCSGRWKPLVYGISLCVTTGWTKSARLSPKRVLVLDSKILQSLATMRSCVFVGPQWVEFKRTCKRAADFDHDPFTNIDHLGSQSTFRNSRIVGPDHGRRRKSTVTYCESLIDYPQYLDCNPVKICASIRRVSHSCHR